MLQIGAAAELAVADADLLIVRPDGGQTVLQTELVIRFGGVVVAAVVIRSGQPRGGKARLLAIGAELPQRHIIKPVAALDGQRKVAADPRDVHKISVLQPQGAHRLWIRALDVRDVGRERVALFRRPPPAVFHVVPEAHNIVRAGLRRGIQLRFHHVADDRMEHERVRVLVEDQPAFGEQAVDLVVAFQPAVLRKETDIHAGVRQHGHAAEDVRFRLRQAG